MEADFGMEGVLLMEGVERPPRSDSLQDFYDMLKAEYGEDEAEVDPGGNEFNCVIDLTGDPDAPAVEFKGKKEQSRDGKRGRGGEQEKPTGKRGKKRRKGGHWSGDAVGEFYGEILSWDLVELYAQSMQLPLSETRVQFNFVSQFYNYCRELVMEEAAASISSGLQQVGRAAAVTLRCSGEASKQVGELMMISAEVVYGPTELTRPGSCFVIYPQKCHYPKFNFQPPKCEEVNRSRNSAKTGIFGAIAPNREAAGTKKVPLYVHESFYASMLEDRMLDRGSLWVAYEVANVITAQRMAVVCAEQPKPHFLSKLQGGKIASHIIFDDAEGEVDRPASLAVVPGSALASARSDSPSFSSGIVPGTSLKRGPAGAASREGFAKRLNASQLTALDDVVRNTCGEESVVQSNGVAFSKKGALSLVQGPPGCGKSTFLTALLEVLVLRRGKRVLACAPSNKAVCVLLEKFLAMKEQDPSHASCEKSIVLIGVEDKLDVNAKIKSSGGALQLAGSDNDGSRNAIAAEQSSWALSEATQAALKAVTNPRSAFDLFAYRLGDHFSAALRALATEMSRFLRRIEEMTHVNIASNILDVKSFLERFRRHVDAIYKRLESACPRATNRDMSSFFAEIFAQLEEAAKCCRSSASFAEDSEEHLKTVESTLNEVAAYAVDSESALAIASEAIANADVVFCTLACSGQSVMKRVQQVDVMVVDEAAQALEPELCISFSLYPDNLVLVGDPCQLSATLLSPRAQQLGRGDSTMKRLMNFCDRPFHLLSTQYRMHPQLSMLPNKLFYKSRISDSDHVIERRRLIGPPTGAVPWLQDFAFIDVEGTEHSRDGAHRFSMSNKEEALFIAKLLRYLASSYSHIDVSTQVCVITFYSGQVGAISGSIRSEAEKMTDRRLAAQMRATQVLTVDSFQGSETDIVILSFVRSNVRHNVGFLSDFSRINVAITRAKHNLLCIGNAPTLENCKLDYLRTLVSDSKDRLKFFSASNISGEYF